MTKLIWCMSSAAAALLIVGGSGSSLPAQVDTGDLTFTIRATSGASGAARSTIERFLISASRMRMEISEDPPNAALGGMYMVESSADTTLMSVMPTLRMAMIMKMPSLPSGLAMGGLHVSNVAKAMVEDLGPGERLLGHDTHHYRITRTRTLTTTLRDRSCTRPIDNIEEVWISTDSVLNAEMRLAERREAALMPMSRADRESWKDVFDAAASAQVPRGLALRTVSRHNPASAGTQTDDSTHTIEYTELSDTPVDSSIFTPPSGFQVQDMRGMDLPSGMSGIGAVVDSTLMAGCRGNGR